MASVSAALEESPISGTYRAGKPCGTDDAGARTALITITAQTVTHPGGVCTLDNERQEGRTVIVRATCKDRRGTVLSGDVSFTVRDDRSLDMTAQGGSYKAALNRCAETPAEPQAECRAARPSVRRRAS